MKLKDTLIGTTLLTKVKAETTALQARCLQKREKIYGLKNKSFSASQRTFPKAANQSDLFAFESDLDVNLAVARQVQVSR